MPIMIFRSCLGNTVSNPPWLAKVTAGKMLYLNPELVR